MQASCQGRSFVYFIHFLGSYLTTVAGRSSIFLKYFVPPNTQKVTVGGKKRQAVYSACLRRRAQRHPGERLQEKKDSHMRTVSVSPFPSYDTF
jgi:hypothetical protein